MMTTRLGGGMRQGGVSVTRDVVTITTLCLALFANPATADTEIAFVGGGDGSNWTDAQNWNPSQDPDNDVLNRFRARIEALFDVELNDADRSVDQLVIGEGNSLRIGNASVVTIQGKFLGVESSLLNDGDLFNDGGLTFDFTIPGTGSLGGAGTVHLTNETTSRLEIESGSTLTIGEDQTITGEGLIKGAFENFGSIVKPDTPGALVFEIENETARVGNVSLLGGDIELRGLGKYVTLKILPSEIILTPPTIQLVNIGFNPLEFFDLNVGDTDTQFGDVETVINPGNYVVDASEFNGTVTHGAGARVAVRNDLVNNAHWLIVPGAGSTNLVFEGDQAIVGDGILELGGLFTRVTSDNSVITNGINHTITGAGTLFNGTGGLVNDGVIAAGAGQTLTIDTNTLGFVNRGIVQTRSVGPPASSPNLPGDIRLGNDQIDNTSGKILANGEPGVGGRILLGGGTDITGGYLGSNEFGSVEVQGGTTLRGVFTGGIVNQVNVGVNVFDGVTNEALWTISPGVGAAFVLFWRR